MWILSSLLALYRTTNEMVKQKQNQLTCLLFSWSLTFLFLKWMPAMIFIWWDWLNVQIQTGFQSPWYIVGDNFIWIYAVVSSTIYNLHIQINVYISNNLFWGWTCSGNSSPYPALGEKIALQKRNIVAMQFMIMCILFWENQNFLKLTRRKTIL